MRIQVVTKDNGLGLSHDFRVLKEAIAKARPDAEVVLVDWQTPARGAKSDINIFLELLAADFHRMAPRNIYVPNPEWFFSDRWGGILPRMDEIWAKTEDCMALFRGLHRRVVKSGWTSEDRMRIPVPVKKAMLHVAGGSSAKGTDQVIAAMAGLPNHHLTLVTRIPRGRVPSNVEVITNPSDDRLAELQSSHLVHLCPSSYEGFGHYINEARSCAAFVITTDAPPMNELVDRENGAGVAPFAYERQNLATHAKVTAGDLVDVIRAVMSADEALLRKIGERSRERYLRERSQFHAFIRQALA